MLTHPRSPIVTDGVTEMIPRVPYAVCFIQPAATLVVHGVIRNHVSLWGTDYRGPLYVCAATTYDDINRCVCNSPSYIKALTSLGYGKDRPLPLGCFVGAATLADCRRVDPGDVEQPAEVVVALNPALRVFWESFGRYLYIWEFTDFVVLEPPRVGRQSPGIYRAPDHVARAVADEGWTPGAPAAIVEPVRTVLQDGALILGSEHDRREGRPLYRPAAHKRGKAHASETG